MDVVNEHAEHCHCLALLSSDQTIEKVAQLIKGESSYWINTNNLINDKFRWKDEYFSVSISYSQQ